MSELRNRRSKYKVKPQVILLSLMLIIDTCFFDIPSLSYLVITINNPHNKVLLCIITSLIFVFNVLSKKIHINNKDKLDKLVLYYIVIVVITFLVSVVRYNQDIVAVVKNYHYYLLLLLYFWLKKWANDEKSYHSIIMAIIYIATFYSAILIICKLLYMSTGKLLLNSDILTVTTRNNTLRLQHTSSIIPLGCILASTTFLNRKKGRIKFAVFSLICLIEIVWITQTRMVILGVLVAIGITFYLASSRKGKWALIVLIIIIATAFSASILEFFGTFSTNSNDKIYAYSTSIRIGAYKHYIENMFHNGVVGIGFINSDSYSLLKFGPGGKYVLSDLGYIGVIGVFGILGVILIIILFKYFFGFAKRMSLNNAYSIFPEAFALALYLLVSSWSLIFNDMQRLFYFPIILILIGYPYNKLSTNDIQIMQNDRRL